MKQVMLVLVSTVVWMSMPAVASAHCDALDGPVVLAARAALEKGDVTPVLRWVLPDREGEIRAAFDRTLAVRTLGGEPQSLADTWFFETLVRVHRAGEGAPFDGLKPAGHIEPFIKVIDGTIETGSADGLLDKVAAHVRSGVDQRFRRTHEARLHADDSVEAGRRYVAAYVEYMHYVENLHKAANGEGMTHAAAAAPGHEH